MAEPNEQIHNQSFVADFWMNCPNCNEDVSGKVGVPEPSWNDVEEISELQSESLSELVCDQCGKPFACHIYFTHGDCTASLVDHPEIDLHIDHPTFRPPESDWQFDQPAADPFEIVKETIDQLTKLLAETNSNDGSSLINRMCFSQGVSAFEAFLADTLINAVQQNEHHLRALLSTDKELQRVKLTLQDAISDDKFVEKTVVKHLQNLLYHNLPRIDPLYKAVYDVSVYANERDKYELHRIMADRHDCVHRNGRTKDGSDPIKYTQLHVIDCLETLNSAATRIHWAVMFEDRREEFWF